MYNHSTSAEENFLRCIEHIQQWMARNPKYSPEFAVLAEWKDYYYQCIIKLRKQ
jgi:hypothetical protein